MENAEKVIFRSERDYFGNETYLAVFPEEKSNPMRYCILPFGFDGHGEPYFEPFGECSWEYYYNFTKVIHKNDERMPKLLETIEQYYGTKFKVMEKVMR